jgi:hypothetical protein
MSRVETLIAPDWLVGEIEFQLPIDFDLKGEGPTSQCVAFYGRLL